MSYKDNHWDVEDCECKRGDRRDCECEGGGRVQRKWHAPKSMHGMVWSDMNSVATIMSVEIDNVVENLAWLRKRSNDNHINVL